MDPLTGLSVASNIISFVSFAFGLITETRKVFCSASGATADSIVIQTIVDDVENFNASLSASRHATPQLRELMSQSSKMAANLQDGLRRLRTKHKRSAWASLKVALEQVWSKDDMNSFLASLGRLQTQVMGHIQFAILSEVSDLTQELRSLSSMNQRLELQNNKNLASLRLEVLDAIKKLASESDDVETDGDGRIDEYFRHQHDNSADLGPPGYQPAAISSDINAAVSVMSQLVREAESVRSDLELLRTLYFSKLQVRHRKIEPAHAKTFQWVYRDRVPGQQQPIRFRQWLRNENGLFWIHGKPGSGKSTLMKFLVQNPSTLDNLGAWAGRKKLVMASFFFWNAGTQLQRSQEGLLRSLLFEILRQCPELIPKVKGSFDSNMLSAEICWSVEELLKMYKLLVSQNFPVKFCFFIDGLDEFNEENKSHVDLIGTLRTLEHSADVKLCVSSRPWTIFNDEFRRDDSKWLLKLEDLTYADIHAYVTDKFNAHPQFRILGAQDPQYGSLIEHVVTRAQGVFLRVVLVVRDMQEGLTHHETVASLESWLLQFPPDLEEFFQHLIDSIPPRYRVHSSSTFKIATMADEPLPLILYSFFDDVHEGVLGPIIQRSQRTRQELDISAIQHKQEQMRRRLDGRTKGLLEIVNIGGQELVDSPYFDLGVDFLHRTVRDFLIQTSIQQKLPQCGDISMAACQAALAVLIKAPFRKTDLARMVTVLDHLFLFARQAEAHEPLSFKSDSRSAALIDILDAAQAEYEKVVDLWQYTEGSSWSRATYDSIFLGAAAQADLYFFLEKSLSIGAPLNRPMSQGHSVFVRPLLDYAVSTRKPWHRISARVVRLLLDQAEHKVPNQLYLGRTVFANFVRSISQNSCTLEDKQLLEILDLLVSRGADLSVQLEAGTGKTAFYPSMPTTSKHGTLKRARAMEDLRAPSLAVKVEDMLAEKFGRGLVRERWGMRPPPEKTKRKLAQKVEPRLQKSAGQPSRVRPVPLEDAVALESPLLKPRRKRSQWLRNLFDWRKV
ncbi:hypothetical protein QBC34DRAFT_363014 [Podospora aff. communis PSN243]|uniref:NACHT domain-containing protein n=1 Tax=Podospora aff. communis PSN243 TaxID=3040156 RepID=A0AAV9G471_9PEZI|nr:hypothetical protein QBC34DRAFT_363014 [Podospora aff. communis PSN243]